MLIPEYQAKKSEHKSEVECLTSLDQYKTLRQATTDKAIVILVSASWDESCQHLTNMANQ